MIDTRALLRMDVLDLAARLPRVFEFYLEGLRILLPRSWVSRGWRIKRELLTVGENGAVQDRLIVERSALGLTRVTNGPGASEPGPAFLLLPRERYFLTQLSLPAAARSSLKETVRLRIAEVSPISPEEVLVAVGPAKNCGRAPSCRYRPCAKARD